MWESPIYRFRIPKDKDNHQFLKEIVIDVTGSAPSSKEPSEGLKKILMEIFGSRSLKVNTVLAFGAGKLRNIPFILEKGKTVCAVDFEKITRSQFTKKNFKTCNKYGSKFQKLIFPRPFISDNKKFDLVLLLNVLPIMPVFAERLYVLKLLYEKTNDGKYLLWVAHGEGSYKKIREKGKNAFGDGIWMGKSRYAKTFYKYHPIEELDEMMALYGFKKIKRFPIGDDARLYEKTEHNLLSDIITPEKIRKHIPVDERIEYPKKTTLKIVKKTSKIKPLIPNPKSLSIEMLYAERIKSISRGTRDAELYHRVVSYALGRIFRGSLRNMKIKIDIDSGIKIIDTIFTNCAKNGFFFNLRGKADCSYPIIEVKNKSKDPSNPDFDQLNGRMNKSRGNFGMLVCRKVKNEKTAFERCKTYLPNNFIFFLTDEDIFELLDYSHEHNQNDINDFMDDKLKNLIF